MPAIRAYHNGEVVTVANIYSEKRAPHNLAIRHGNSVGYVPLTSEANTGAPCIAFWHDGAIYRTTIANSIPITGNAWYALASDNTTWGWLAANSTTQSAGYLDDGDSNVTVWITHINSINGSPNAASGVLAAGKTINEVKVTGSNASALTLTIGGVKYRVDISGELAALPAVSTKIINRTRRAGSKIKSSQIGYVNPDATDDQLATFMNALNGLSDNASAGFFRVDKHPR